MNKDLKEAIEMFEKIENNPQMKALYDAYFKQVTDEVNRLETAREEGRMEARMEAIMEGQIQERQFATRKLLKSGMTLEQIEEILGFDPKKYL